MKQKPKILLLDIETSFKVAGVWGRYKQDIAMNQLLQDSYVLCWAAKWLGSSKIYSDALYLHKTAYKKDPTNDKKVLQSVWKLLDKADIVVAHNGDGFDIKVLNARFIEHGMVPPSAYTTIDTLKIAKRAFRFTSNRLDDLAKILKVGKKLATGGFDLWKKIVIDRNQSAFKKMVAYNKQDVRLLEQVFRKLRAWTPQLPGTLVHEAVNRPTCNACGSIRVKKDGTYRTQAYSYRKFKCLDCGHNMRARTSLTKSNPNVLKSI